MYLSAAISGFLLFKEAAGLRPNTLTLYRYHLSLLAGWLGDDPAIEAITTEHLTAFLAYMRLDYQPRRTNGDDGPLASQSIYNIWTALKSFYKWLAATLDLPDAMADIPRPKARNVEQQPFTEEEVKRLFEVAAPRKRKRATSNVRYINELRDQAILLTLLDTGLRAGELAALVGLIAILLALFIMPRLRSAATHDSPAGGSAVNPAQSSTSGRLLASGRGTGDEVSADFNVPAGCSRQTLTYDAEQAGGNDGWVNFRVPFVDGRGGESLGPSDVATAPTGSGLWTLTPGTYAIEVESGHARWSYELTCR